MSPWKAAPFLLLSFVLSEPSRAEHAQAVAAAMVEIGSERGSTWRESLKAMGLKAWTLPRLELRDPARYEDSKYFRGNTYYKSAVIKLTDLSEAREIGKGYDRCRRSGETSKRLATAYASGERTIPLERLLPDFVCERVGTCSPDSGPNCFNATLLFHNCTKETVCTGSEELLRVLKKEFTPVESGETLQPGDVLVIYKSDDGKTIQHSAVYVGGDVFFHKGSTDKADPYTFEPFESVVSFYRYGKEVPLRFFRKNP